MSGAAVRNEEFTTKATKVTKNYNIEAGDTLQPFFLVILVLLVVNLR